MVLWQGLVFLITASQSSVSLSNFVICGLLCPFQAMDIK